MIESMVRSCDSENDFFHTINVVLQGDIMGNFLFINCLD